MALKPNLNVDKLLESKDINIKFYNIIALNLKTGFLDPYSIFHYTANLYQREDDSKYYLFNRCENCTMYIINCNKEIYDELKNYITLNDDIEIWETFISNSYQIIPICYRHTTWYGGPIVAQEL